MTRTLAWSIILTMAILANQFSKIKEMPNPHSQQNQVQLITKAETEHSMEFPISM